MYVSSFPNLFYRQHKRMRFVEKITKTIVTWLREQVEKSHTKGLVVGVSGGLDSAVVAFLMQRAFPNESLGVIMPLKSSDRDITHARSVVQACNINNMTVDLTATHDVLFQEIKRNVQTSDWNDEKEQIADANLRARLRMSTLYTIATNYNYLVVGTDNAAEWFTGYFTKYGDGGVDIQPIIDLTKGEVVELARYLGVPTEVIEKKPSADLWVGQTDEEELGTSYTYIDRYLRGEKIPDQDRKVIESLHERTAHKRQIAPQLRLKS